MPCTCDFIEFFCQSLSPLGEVYIRRIMGDYIIYVNGKCVITACDNIAYIKKCANIADIIVNAETGYPYPGSKEAYILDFSDMQKKLEVITLLWNNLPWPKSTNKKVSTCVVRN